MVYTLRYFSSKCSLFHNSNLFGSCIIYILYTESAKIKKKDSGAKRHFTKVTLPLTFTNHNRKGCDCNKNVLWIWIKTWCL